MPSYVIKMNKPKTCRDCPCIWEDRTEGLEPSECQLADKWLPPQYSDNEPPSWCPLKPIASLRKPKHAKAKVTSVQEFVNVSGPFPVAFDLNTLQCDGCGFTSVVLISTIRGRPMYCPFCGAALRYMPYDSEFHRYVLQPVD